MAGDLTISPNVSWVFAASNRELEHNLIFLKWTLADETLHADYLAQPLSTISDGVIAASKTFLVRSCFYSRAMAKLQTPYQSPFPLQISKGEH